MIQTTDVTSAETAVIMRMTVPVVAVEEEEEEAAEEEGQGKKLTGFFFPKCVCSLELHAV